MQQSRFESSCALCIFHQTAREWLGETDHDLSDLWWLAANHCQKTETYSAWSFSNTQKPAKIRLKKLPTKILLSWDWKDESSEVFWGGDFLFILAMACILVVTRSSETETVARLPSTSSSEASTYGKSLETWTTNQTFDVIPMFFNVTLYLYLYLYIYIQYIHIHYLYTIYRYYIYIHILYLYIYIHITCAPCL